MKKSIVIVIGMILSVISLSCEKEKVSWMVDEEYRIIKLSIEPCSATNCRDGFANTNPLYNREVENQPGYRIFTIGNRSSWSIVASSAGLFFSEKDYNYLHITGGGDDVDHKFLGTISNKIYLVPCSKFRDTQKYLVKDSRESSSALLGLVYQHSAEEDSQYQVRDEDFVMPCLKGN